ncbi:hypothetical protein [Streptomyces sp. NPDC086777]|uniref:hypothetical protein n=1 Tax=Streptomyces sp. NPDC086777 TaxID=3154866 RepID=UPI00344CD3C4
MEYDPLASRGHAEVRIVDATPEAARRAAEVLRHRFVPTGQRGHPAGEGGGTRLHLALDTARTAGRARSWRTAGESTGQASAHADEV